MTTEMKKIYRPSGLMNMSKSLIIINIKLISDEPCPLNPVISGLVNGSFIITGTIAVKLTMVARPEPLSIHPVTHVVTLPVTLPHTYNVKPSLSASY